MATTSPGASADRAMWPGPVARIMTSGRPASLRFQPPAIGMLSIRTVGSTQSRTWWEK